MHHQGRLPLLAHGAGWGSGCPHPGLSCQVDGRSQTWEAKKALKEAVSLPGCVFSSRQLKWKLASEVPGRAPPGQVPGFPCGLPGGGTGAVIRMGVPAPAPGHMRTNARAPRTPCAWPGGVAKCCVPCLAHPLGPPAEPWGERLPALRRVSGSGSCSLQRHSPPLAHTRPRPVHSHGHSRAAWAVRAAGA